MDFHLRPNLRFDTGDPLDAAAVKASFDRARDPELKNVYRSLFAMIDRVDVVDGTDGPLRQCVSVPRVRPDAGPHGGLHREPEARADAGPAARSVDRGCLGRRAGTGSRDGRAIVRSCSSGTPTTGASVPPPARVIYRIIPEAVSRRAALEAGDVGVVMNIAPADVRPISADPRLVVHAIDSVGSRALIFNCARGPFRDPRVRQAVSYAIDRRAIVEGMFDGRASVPTGPLAPLINGYVPLGEIAYDPGRAKRLLAAAGFPKGFTTRLWTSPGTPFGVEVAEVLVDQLSRIGIRASLEVVDWVTWVTTLRGQRREESPLDLFIGGYGGSTGDADWALRPRFTTEPTNATNWGFYSNAEFDDVIVRAMKEPDAERRLALYKRAQQIIYFEDPAAAWMFGIQFVVASRKSVTNLTISPLGLVTFERAVQLAN